jgi:hypothetical protein
MMINLIKPSFQKYVVYYDKIFANQLTEMLSFLKVKPLPGAKKQFPNVSSRVKSISDRKVLSSKSIPMDLTPDILKVDDSAGIFPNRFGYVPTAVSGTSLHQQKSLVCSSLIPLDFKSKIPVRKIFRTASKPDVKLNQAKVVSALRKSDSRSKDVELRKPFRASPVPSSTYKAPRQFIRSQLPVTENVVTKTHEDVKQKLIIATPAPSPRTVHQQPIRPVDENISAYDDQKPEPIEITEQMIVDKIPTSVTEDTISDLTSLPIDLNTDEDVLTTDGPASSVSSEVSPPQSTDELETDEPLPMIEIQPLGVEPNSVDPPINAAVITGSTITELETSPETSPDDGPAAILLPVFTSCDFRYKGQSHIPGYTVIPNQTSSPAQLEDIRQCTPELDRFVVDTPRPVTPLVEFEHPFDNFRIRDKVIKTEGQFMDVLSNIPAIHFGRILGKNCQRVTILRERFKVKISVVRQTNTEDRIQVFIDSGLPSDRHEVADYLVEEVIPVQVDVNFGAGFLTKSKKIMARQRYRYVAIDEIDRQGHCILRGRLADCRNLFDDFKYGRY